MPRRLLSPDRPAGWGRIPGWTAMGLLLVTSACTTPSRVEPPTQRAWLAYRSPEDAGFSPEKLMQAKAYCDSTAARAVMIICRGHVVVAWGDVERRYKCHSVRKSLLNALYGLYVARGKIDLDRTLGDLGITDHVELTDLDKTATVRDLLRTRSGVYLPAALEERDATRPRRGSHVPGTFQFYNNWDFNVLGSIFRQETKEDLFEAFRREIATPLGMEDFRAMDGAYEYEGASLHPGYPIKMSTRDLARFGQLYLQRGLWNGRPILDEDWIDASLATASSSSDLGNGATGYGYLWWLQERVGEPRQYFALGWGEQYLGIFPELELVIVIRSDSYFGDYLDDGTRQRLVERLVGSRIRPPSANPTLVALSSSPPAVASVILPEAQLERFAGSYELPEVPLRDLNRSFSIRRVDSGLEVEGIHYNYRFRLLAVSDATFLIEDLNLRLSFDLDEAGRPIHPRLEPIQKP